MVKVLIDATTRAGIKLSLPPEEFAVMPRKGERIEVPCDDKGSVMVLAVKDVLHGAERFGPSRPIKTTLICEAVE